jgi:RhtB (resistance to homoserine/threonine) family protein
MSSETLVAAAIVLAILTVSPGADTALVTMTTISQGRRAALLATLGIVCGLPIHATASALGLAAILATSATLYAVVKIVGGTYLAWLGIQALRSARRGGIGAEPSNSSQRTPFIRGFLSNVLNPKVALFYLTFLPQFITPGDAGLAQALLLAGVHAIEGIAWLVLYAYLIDRVAGAVRSSTFRRGVEAISGLVLVGLGVRVVADTR